MNTIKFSKIENITTEQHNLEILDIREESIFGRTLKIYHPCNLNIFITNVCHNNCDFCINRDYSNTDILDKDYFNSLEKVLRELKGKGFEITITGGEPTLLKKRFVETLRLCKEYGFPCRTVSTTGLLLTEKYEGKSLCRHLIENDFIHNINISRMAISDFENEKIFNCKNNTRNISNKDISKLATYFKLNDAEMRISCNLLEGFIDSFPKMLEFVDFYRNLDVETVMFRELEGVGNPIRLKDIVNFTDEFKYIETLRGSAYIVDIYKYKDMLIKYYETNKDIPKDVIFSLSLRNGILRDGFVGKKFEERLI